MFLCPAALWELRETPVSKVSAMEVNNDPSATSRHFAAIELMLLEGRRRAGGAPVAVVQTAFL